MRGARAHRPACAEDLGARIGCRRPVLCRLPAGFLMRLPLRIRGVSMGRQHARATLRQPWQPWQPGRRRARLPETSPPGWLAGTPPKTPPSWSKRRVRRRSEVQHRRVARARRRARAGGRAGSSAVPLSASAVPEPAAGGFASAEQFLRVSTRTARRARHPRAARPLRSEPIVREYPRPAQRSPRRSSGAHCRPGARARHPGAAGAPGGPSCRTSPPIYAFFFASIAPISWGTTVKRSPTTPKSAISKIGASASLLIATIVLAVCMPARC